MFSKLERHIVERQSNKYEMNTIVINETQKRDVFIFISKVWSFLIADFLQQRQRSSFIEINTYCDGITIVAEIKNIRVLLWIGSFFKGRFTWNNVRHFLKLLSGNFPGIFFPSGNFQTVRFPKGKLPKSVLNAAGLT